MKIFEYRADGVKRFYPTGDEDKDDQCSLYFLHLAAIHSRTHSLSPKRDACQTRSKQKRREASLTTIAIDQHTSSLD